MIMITSSHNENVSIDWKFIKKKNEIDPSCTIFNLYSINGEFWDHYQSRMLIKFYESILI